MLRPAVPFEERSGELGKCLELLAEGDVLGEKKRI
jgi:hypothetical protein